MGSYLTRTKILLHHSNSCFELFLIFSNVSHCRLWHIKLLHNVTCFVAFLKQVNHFLLVMQTILLQFLSLPIFSLFPWSHTLALNIMYILSPLISIKQHNYITRILALCCPHSILRYANTSHCRRADPSSPPHSLKTQSSN